MESMIPPIAEAPPLPTIPPTPTLPAVPLATAPAVDIMPIRAPAPEPLPEAAKSPAARIMAELPPVSMALPADSGLQLVETVHRLVPTEPEAVEPPAPRRVRPPRVEAADEPLQIVETRKEQPPAH
jgi:hypothetical protein